VKLALALLLACTVAHAGGLQDQAVKDPDPAADRAGDANLESKEHRSGLTFAGSLGGSVTLGFGIKDSVGRGGSLSLRLGHVATPRTLITFEVAFDAVLHQPPGMNSSIETNSNTDLVAGAQYYVNPSFWIRGGGGVGIYQGRQVALSNGQRGNLQLIGPAALGGFGIDFVRVKYVVFGFEGKVSAMASNQGVLMALALGLGLSID
jgi:hypothetical protein